MFKQSWAVEARCIFCRLCLDGNKLPRFERAANGEGACLYVVRIYQHRLFDLFLSREAHLAHLGAQMSEVESRNSCLRYSEAEMAVAHDNQRKAGFVGRFHSKAGHHPELA